MGMQRRDQLRGVALDLRGNAATIILDEIHDEQIWLCDIDGWDRKVGVTGELAKHVGLEEKIGARSSLPQLHRETAPIGEVDLVSGKPEADRHRRDHRHAHAERPFDSIFHHGPAQALLR